MKKDFIESKLTGKFRPLFVSWFVTDQCNMSCSKCRRGCGELKHAPDEIVDKVIEEAGRHKVWRVSLTGGEPLLHPRLGNIIDGLNRNGVRVSVSSNGLLVPDKIDSLAGVTGVSLSLDGGPETHDSERRAGAYETVLAALGALDDYGISAKITSVISRRTTVQDIDDVIAVAKAYNAPASFQPSLANALGSDQPNPDSPDQDVFQAAMQRVLRHKGMEPRLILNSVKGLRHLMRWPQDTAITCGAGRFFCQIDPAGNLYTCGNSQGAEKALGNIADLGLMAPFKQKTTCACTQCWCGERVEANLIFGLDPHALINYFRTRHGYD